MTHENKPEQPQSGGILITRGTSIQIPAGGLRIRLGSDPGVDPVTLHLALNMWLPWLEIAMEHLHEAKTQHDLLIAARDSGGQVAEPLVRESQAAMQAMVAAAISFDALYAAAKERISLPPSVIKRWRERGTARYSQVSEVLRRAFCLKKQSTANVRSVTKELYRFRDIAVHPPASYSQPILHPDLASGTERRLVIFSFSNAQPAVRAALAYVKILPSRPLDRATGPMKQLAADMLKLGEPLFEQWEAEYGPLLDQPDDAT
jgi:hypothetical protein